MAKGRPPDPTRARRGTGHRPKPGEAKAAKALVAVPVRPRPVVEVEEFPPPAALPDEVHAVWRAVVVDLGGAGHLRAAFLPQIEAYCAAVWLHAQATAIVREEGVVVLGMNGSVVVNPAVRVQKDAAATMLRFADAFGLTAASRIRLALVEVAGMSLLASLNAGLDKRT